MHIRTAEQSNTGHLQAKAMLERRRMERLEQDERMRKPWQQPPPPKKPILRARQHKKPVQAAPLDEARRAELDARKADLERQRREWRDGLRQQQSPRQVRQ